ncbi:MAG: DUF2063 domain-containing protein [Alphaproteobacteria bacterium]|nr:MAG: DUF2063 domain-containing protein [Alphaproteobacteria bacterium]
MPEPIPQAALAAALLAPPGPGPAHPRLAIHRNNVVGGLVAALGEVYPAVRRLVGEAFFRAMAADFVRAHPPEGPVLIAWGGALADWIAAFPPAGRVPYLADVARLEWARAEAYNAADAAPMTGAALAARAAADLPATRLMPHPALRLVHSRYPVASLWAELTGRPGAPVDMARAETAVVARPFDEVLVAVADPAHAAALGMLARGATLAELTEAAGPDRLAEFLRFVFDHGLVAGAG